MDSDEKCSRAPFPANDESEQSPKDAWLEQEASIVSNGYNVFFDPYEHLAPADEPNN